MNCNGAYAESLFPLFFSFSASFKSSSPKEKVGKLSSVWDWWTESLSLACGSRSHSIFLSPKLPLVFLFNKLDYEPEFLQIVNEAQLVENEGR